MLFPRRKAYRRFWRFCAQYWLQWQYPLSYRETNTRLNIHSRISANPENLVEIGLVGSEMSLLQAIIKKEEKYYERESNSSKT